MAGYKMAARNARHIPKEDKIFGINRRAKQAIAERGKDAVINATIGTLLDDNGNLMVLKTVDRMFHELTADEFAAYAPIGGTPEFKKAAIRAAFSDNLPKGYIEAVATPGGTGAIRNTIANYSAYRDKVLTTDWFWTPYETICEEMGRTVDVFKLFDVDGAFNIDSFEIKVNSLLEAQERLVIILNTPAHNPTGYALTVTDWENVVRVLNRADSDARITLLIDAAYIDFAGDEMKYREFLPVLSKLHKNILPLMAYSMSKTFTLYGMRCGALICIAPTEEVAAEFKRVVEFSSRGCWSNSPRAPQSIITRIFADEELHKEVTAERAEIRELLLTRGRAFEEECHKIGLKSVPFDAGFFVAIPCKDPMAICNILEEEDIFLIPHSRGVRVSVASIPESKCRALPAKILEAFKKYDEMHESMK